MRKPPKVLFVLALSFIAISAMFPVQALWIYDLSFGGWGAALNQISLMNFIVILACVGNIPVLLRASRWLVITLPTAVLSVAYNNFLVATRGEDFSLATTSLSTLAFLGLSSLVFHPQVLGLLKNPRQRWWLQSPRKRVALPIQLDFVRGPSRTLTSFNLSGTGLFIHAEEEKIKLSVGEHVRIRLPLGGIRSVACQAQVVRQSCSQGPYPSGYGLAFTQISKSDRKSLKTYVAAVREL